MNPKPAKYRINRAAYASEFDQFLGDYLDEHPEVEEDQRRGWYIWWDHRVDLDELDKQRQDAVPVKPYYYE
ncbi:DUF3460 family protein [Massilia glaciei]|uniref:DUF3460 domain-containing protein n=1 Tax=Massilia glaciei TaxID=1524097 RepID=A0A2U2HE05_9BURK|nr:DUF3460 family protein [Massilia glaciei]PWF41540.1 DUF3460 domain-containing protein [Massilia glaciei]